jgi:hypothetical protein
MNYNLIWMYLKGFYMKTDREVKEWYTRLFYQQIEKVFKMNLTIY